jgi:hypothetical protein
MDNRSATVEGLAGFLGQIIRRQAHLLETGAGAEIDQNWSIVIV